MNIIGITGQASSGKDTIAARLVDEYNYQQIALADPLKRFGYHVFSFDTVQLWGPSQMRNAFDPRYTLCEIRSSGLHLDAKSLSSVKRACDAAWGAAAAQVLEYGQDWLKEVLSDDDDYNKAFDLLCYWFVSLGHKHSELSPRIMLQSLGTQFGRESISEDVWIDYALKLCTKLLRGQGSWRYSPQKGAISCEIEEKPSGIVISDVRFTNELTAIKAAGGRVIRVERDVAKGKVGIENHASEVEQQGFNINALDAVINNNKTLDDLYDAVDMLVNTTRGQNT